MTRADTAFGSASGNEPEARSPEVSSRPGREERSHPLGPRIAHPVGRVAPWLAFAAVLGWGWRTTDLFHTIPSYGDVLEGLWALLWYADALRLGHSSALYPLAFHPVGMYVATYAWGPVNFILMFPFYLLGGAAFAYNMATLITLLLAFAGMYLLARMFVSRLGATVAALLYTFWGFRWYGIIGQLNVNLGSALLPWTVWSLERGWRSRSPGRAKVWFVLAGAIWAASISSSLYYIWISGVAVLGWLIGRLITRGTNWRATLTAAVLVPISAGVLSLPAVLRFWRASGMAAAPFFTIYDVNVLGASLNSLPIPYLWHPWLQTLARAIYHGPTDAEASMANLGLLACLMALVGLTAAWRTKAWRPVLVLICLGLILALGLTLQWDDRMIQVGLLRPVNQLIWRVGYSLKPSFFFVGPEPPGDFNGAVPLPGLFLATLVPFFTGARVLARYALVAGIGIFLLAALGLAQVQRTWLRLALAGLLIFEVLPPPTLSFSFPPPSHPAFEWLRQQSIAPDGIVELNPEADSRLAIPVGGSPLWATRYHNQPTVSGILGVWPAHVAYLMQWLAAHPHPLQNPEFASLLRYYRVRYMLLHMHNGGEDAALNEARQNDELSLVQCFPPATGAQPYDYPICVFEILPSRTPSLNVLFREGWSGPEAWGRWIDGTEARAQWIAMERAPHRLSLEAFPFCAPPGRFPVAGQQQKISFEVNKVPLGTHQWTDCESWSGEITIPTDLIRVGSNELTIRTAYAMRPIDVTRGENQDPRALSVGVTRLRVDGGL